MSRKCQGISHCKECCYPVNENVICVVILCQSPERRSKQESLLLSQLFTAGSANNIQHRRRSRSMAERVMLDSERQRAIMLYRQLKASRLH